MISTNLLLLPNCCFQDAICKHESQNFRFRGLYILCSRYVYLNTYKLLDKEDVQLVLQMEAYTSYFSQTKYFHTPQPCAQKLINICKFVLTSTRLSVKQRLQGIAVVRNAFRWNLATLMCSLVLPRVIPAGWHSGQLASVLVARFSGFESSSTSIFYKIPVQAAKALWWVSEVIKK